MEQVAFQRIIVASVIRVYNLYALVNQTALLLRSDWAKHRGDLGRVNDRCGSRTAPLSLAIAGARFRLGGGSGRDRAGTRRGRYRLDRGPTGRRRRCSPLRRATFGQAPDPPGSQSPDSGEGRARLPDLRIVYANKKIGDAGLQALSGSRSIETLDLTGAPITDGGIAHLSRLSSLEELALSQTSVGNACLVSLAKIPGLRMLELSDTQVTSSGLAPLAQLKHLRIISLSWERLSRDDLEGLAELGHLRTIVLNGVPLPDDTMAQLRHECSRTESVIDVRRDVRASGEPENLRKGEEQQRRHARELDAASPRRENCSSQAGGERRSRAGPDGHRSKARPMRPSAVRWSGAGAMLRAFAPRAAIACPHPPRAASRRARHGPSPRSARSAIWPMMRAARRCWR